MLTNYAVFFVGVISMINLILIVVAFKLCNDIDNLQRETELLRAWMSQNQNEIDNVKKQHETKWYKSSN